MNRILRDPESTPQTWRLSLGGVRPHQPSFTVDDDLLHNTTSQCRFEIDEDKEFPY